jgi:hypothetical protein
MATAVHGTSSLSAVTHSHATTSNPQNDAIQAVKGLLSRLDPLMAKSTLDQFSFELIGGIKCKGKTKLCFGYSSTSTGARKDVHSC